MDARESSTHDDDARVRSRLASRRIHFVCQSWCLPTCLWDARRAD
jgi:hypothetical protein